MDNRIFNRQTHTDPGKIRPISGIERSKHTFPCCVNGMLMDMYFSMGSDGNCSFEGNNTKLATMGASSVKASCWQTIRSYLFFISSSNSSA